MSSFSDYLKLQIRESQSEENRYFASLYYKREVNDPEELLRYYIKYGGAKDFSDTYHKRNNESGDNKNA